MPLLEKGRVVADPWVTVADDAPLPEDGAPALLTLDRVLRDAARNAPLGVVLPPDADPACIAPLLDRLALVVLRFPKHRDGRAFTQARALRETHGYTGEIRATGHVLPDQYAFLLRCGVTSVELPEGADLAPWHDALRIIPLAYQPAAVGDAEPLGLLRRHVSLA